MNRSGRIFWGILGTWALLFIAVVMPCKSWGENEDRVESFVYGFRPDQKDIIGAVKLLCKGRDFNLIIGEEIKGEVKVVLHDVTFEEALDAILSSGDLTYHRRGKTIFIGTKHMESRIYRLRYVKPSKVDSLITPLLSKSARTTTSDELQVLMVKESQQFFGPIEAVIRTVDVAPLQVLIEARILEIELTDDFALGVDWNYLQISDDLQHLGGPEATASLQTQGFGNLASSGGSGLFFTFNNYNIELALDALAEKTDINTLSSPKILVLNGKEAQILIGGKLGYRVLVVTETSSAETVQFLEVGITLTIKPWITDQGDVLMEIHPEVSSGTVEVGLPTKNTTEATTELRVHDGDTALIGGLIKKSNQITNRQVPFLGDIPFLGYLFKRKEIKEKRSEIVVLVTPRIVRDRLNEIALREMDSRISRIHDKEIKQELFFRDLEEVEPIPDGPADAGDEETLENSVQGDQETAAPPWPLPPIKGDPEGAGESQGEEKTGSDEGSGGSN